MSDTNVVDIFAKRNKKEDAEVAKDLDTTENDVSFEEIAKKNKAKADKLAAKRLQANKGVLRSYRIQTKNDR